MLVLVKVLGELLGELFFFSRRSKKEIAGLLVPGLTPTIATQLHGYLIVNQINSFLVVGDNGNSRREK